MAHGSCWAKAHLPPRASCGTKAPPPPRAQPKSQFEFVPRDTEQSEFLDLVDIGVDIGDFSGNCHSEKDALER